jgi:hypothetical protein
MRSMRRTFALTLILAAACTRAPASGLPPTLPAASAGPASTHAAAAPASTATPTLAPAPSGVPFASPSPNAGAAASATLTPATTATAPPTATVAGALSAQTAVSVTEVAVLEQAGTAARLKVDALAWSPSGDTLAAAGEGGVILYSLTPLTITQSIGLPAWATSAAFAPNGDTLAVGSVDGTVRVWDWRAAELRLVLTGPGVRVEHLAYDPAGRFLATQGADGRMHLWDVLVQRYLGELAAEPGPPRGVAFSLDGRRLAGAAGSTLYVWDAGQAERGASAPSLRLTLPGGAAIAGFALRPDGQAAAIGDTSGTLGLWDVAAGAAVQTLPRQAGPAEALAFSPDGALLASAHPDHAIRLWDVAAGGEPRATLTGHSQRVTSLAFSPDGTRLASASWDATVRLWGLRP